jgi:two-component system, OmpR family, response regulator
LRTESEAFLNAFAHLTFIWRADDPGVNAGTILVVEDDSELLELLLRGLREEGFAALGASTGHQAVERASAQQPDALVIDVGLPDADGRDVCQALRASGVSAPVLFLTAHDTAPDKLSGFAAGGDDYITKPFALEELVARVRVALRRRGGTPTPSGRHQVHDLVLDEDQHRVWRGETEVHLTATEFSLLRLLLTNAGRVVTRAQILDHVWQYDFAGETAIIESFVSTLRKKVDAVEPKLVHTVRGVGYTVREP